MTKSPFQMYMRDIICNPYYSTQLKQLGIKKSSTFYWIKAGDGYKLNIGNVAGLPDEFHYPAYSVGELGEMLPARINVVDIKDGEGNPLPSLSFVLRIKKSNAENIKWIMNYNEDLIIGEDFVSKQLIQHNIHDSSEANARAKLLLWLIEQNIVRPKDEK